MVHIEVTSNWVYEHYLIYLYLSIADVDCLISGEELEGIRKKIFKTLDPERCNKVVQEVFREFRSHTEDERKSYIKDNVSRFLRSESIRKKVINELAEIVPSQEDCLEQVMFRYIRRIINSAS